MPLEEVGEGTPPCVAEEEKLPPEAFMNFFSATVGDSWGSPAMLIPTSRARPERQWVSKNGHSVAAAGPEKQAARALDEQQNNFTAELKWVDQVT